MKRQHDMSTGSAVSRNQVPGAAHRTLVVAVAAGLLFGGAGVAVPAAAAASPGAEFAARAIPAAMKAASSVCDTGAVALMNSGFEQPSIGSGYRIFNHSLLPGWSTTASDRAVELWVSGFQGVMAFAGTQFAELNANEPSALYQDLATRPGMTIHWSLAHRGRNGVDVMRVLIGPPHGQLREVAQISDGNRAWGRHNGEYTVPAGQSQTRFQFEAVSAAGGPSVGNFLDDITFGNDACIELRKSGEVIGAGAPGDRVRWTVSATNKGGSPATNLVIIDPIPARTTYGSRSLAMDTGPRAGALTDAADADAGSSDGTRVRVVPFGETKIAGRLNPGETARFTFETALLETASGTTLVNTATAEYEVASGGDRTATASDTVTVPVATDVSITKT
ncbi:MAG: hypothetical protein RL745_650, partial [Actinomycetota bacterium]